MKYIVLSLLIVAVLLSANADVVAQDTLPNPYNHTYCPKLIFVRGIPHVVWEKCYILIVDESCELCVAGGECIPWRCFY